MDLERELQHYESIKADLLASSEGRLALIVGEELLGVFDDEAEAYNAGLDKWGNVPMLIKRVRKEEPVETIPAMTLGLLRARF